MIIGNFHQVSIDSPLPVLEGDQLLTLGNTLQVWRDGVLVATRTMTVGPVVDPNPQSSSRVITELFIYREVAMPGQNVALIGVTVGAGDSVTAKFSNGENTEYASWDDLKTDVSYVDTTGKVAQDLLLALTVRRSPDGADKTNMVGGSVAINCDADTPVVVTYPE